MPPAIKATGNYLNSSFARIEAQRARLRRGDPAQRGRARSARAPARTSSSCATASSRRRRSPTACSRASPATRSWRIADRPGLRRHRGVARAHRPLHRRRDVHDAARRPRSCRSARSTTASSATRARSPRTLAGDVLPRSCTARSRTTRTGSSASSGAAVSAPGADDAWSRSTTRPCATARSARASRSRSRTSCASPRSSTSSASHYIEGGFPGSNPKDIEFFERARDLQARARRSSRRSARRGARTRRGRGRPGPRGAARHRVPRRCASSARLGPPRHRGAATRPSTRTCAMVRDSVAYLKAAGPQVFFDAEHFFDGYNAQPRVRARGRAARRPRPAPTRSCCATPTAARCRTRSRASSARCRGAARRAARHPHPQRRGLRGRQLARRGRRAAATQVQGTINGYGERAGNADLIAIIPALELKMGDDCVTRRPARACSPRSSHFVAEIANLAPNPHQPYVGTSAFAHKGGCTRARRAGCPSAYEHVDPARSATSRASS